MKGMDMKLTSVIVRRLLGNLGTFGPISGTSWTHS